MVPVALTKVEGTEPGGSLEVPIALAEVERAEQGQGPYSGGYVRWRVPFSFGVMRHRRVAVVVFGMEVVF